MNNKQILGATWERARDTWVRARTNAFAHELAAKRQSKIGHVIFICQAVLTVVPIIAISIALTEITNLMNQESSQYVQVSSLYAYLGLIVVISNGLVLFLTLLSTHYRWNEKSLNHKEMLASYSLIAQKIRQVDKKTMKRDAADQLCDHLQDLFESSKNKALEPSDKLFKKAQEILTTLNAYPFELTSDQLKSALTDQNNENERSLSNAKA